MKSSNEKSNNKRYGLIAGWGNYPVLIAQALKKDGHFVYCLGVTGHASSRELRQICDVYLEMGLGRFGTAIRFFRKHQVTETTMAGKIFKKFLLRPGLIWRHLPDIYTFLTFFPLFLAGKSDLKDDTLLLLAVKAFEKKGIKLVPATDLAPELLIPRGILTYRKLSDIDYDDVRLAWPLVREIGRLDFGQAVMVRDGKILAIEGIDGTDETIVRAGIESGGKPFTVIKLAKPNQDMRFDVPAVGIKTLEKMGSSGANVLVIEANRTLCVDPRPMFIERANQFGIAVASIEESELIYHRPDYPSDSKYELYPLTKNQPSARQLKDIYLGIPVMRSLSRFGAGHAVTVRERSILAVRSSVESYARVVKRTAKLAPDGFTLILRCHFDEKNAAEFESLMQEIDKSNIQVIAVDPTPSAAFLSQLIQHSESKRIPLVQMREIGC